MKVKNIKSTSNTLDSLATLFKKAPIVLDNKKVDKILQHINLIKTDLDLIIISCDKLDNFFTKANLSNTELIRLVTTSSDKDINNVFKNFQKQLVKDKPALQKFQKEGILKTIRYIAVGWNFVVEDILEDFSKFLDEYKQSKIKSENFKLATLMYMNIYTLSPIVEYLCRNLYNLIFDCLYIYEEVDPVKGIHIPLNAYIELLPIILSVINTKSMSTEIDKNIKKRGINLKLFGKEYSVFNIIKLSDLSTSLIKLLKVTPYTKEFIGSDYLINRKIKKGAKLQDKKDWYEAKILYLKMQKAETVDSDKLKRLQRIIDKYEASLQKIDNKLNELYI